MQTPAEFPRVERDSLPCPRKVSRGLTYLPPVVSVTMTLGKEWVWGWLFPLGLPADWLCPQGVFSVRDRQTGGGSDLRAGGQGLLCGLGPPQPLSEPGFLSAPPEITLRSLMSMQLIVAAACGLFRVP